ncbi:alpha/beta fold hydrolase [Solicola gregarius]|uniref:Alpha/beta fold hydrolase n=1 Tax=Solicola gregarius TaxID=2908642 RepID=A0AA46YKL1_9ACTN|nr:alpha/beta fold hydrolase [Solicola gregarius]UYM04694.1 alpha/beta fold hydrolase [Solicola gregarius]
MAVQGTLHQADVSTGSHVPPWPQEIRFCRAPDGARLAFAMAGSGYPMVTTCGFMGNLEYDPGHPVFAPVLDAFKARWAYLRYDERGDGLSQGSDHDFSLRTRVKDLEAVVDAAGLDRFALFGASFGGPLAIAYAARHPDRVSHLILASTYARGPAFGVAAAREAEAFARLIRVGWAKGARVRHTLSTGLIPGATAETVAWFDDHQPILTSGEAFAVSYLSRLQVDVSALLPRVIAPAVVVHTRDDMMASFSEACRMTAEMPHARLIAYGGGGHVFPEHWPHAHRSHDSIHAIADFISTPPAKLGPKAEPLATLSAREVSILDLASYGLSNEAMASRLCLSVRTIERHMSNIYAKLQLTGPTARTAAVGMHLRRRR